MSSKSILVAADGSFPLFVDEQYPIISHVCIHSFVAGHLGCFHILASVNKAAVNFGVHVSVLISVFGFFGYILRNGIAWP